MEGANRWHLANSATWPKVAKFNFGCIPAIAPATASALPSQPFTLKKMNNYLNPIP